jgi:hypothetical protein
MWKLTIAIIAFLFFLSVNTNNAFASTCGDGICNTNPPNAEWVSCPQDCPINNTILIRNLSSQISPVVSGLPVYIEGGCTIGTIFNVGGIFYGLIANHCVTFFGTFYTNLVHLVADDSIIGEVIGRYYAGDIALLKFNVTSSSTDFLNNTVDCIAGNYSENESSVYYKIGKKTGLTFGHIFNTSHETFQLVSIDNATRFAYYGDSGSGIVIVGEPRMLFGVVQHSIPENENILQSVSPFVIADVYERLPVCNDSRPPRMYNISILSPEMKEYYGAENIWFNITVNGSMDSCIVSLINFVSPVNFSGNVTDFTMTNSSGNWNYNITFPYVNYSYPCSMYFTCNDSSGNLVRKYGNDFFVSPFPVFLNVSSPIESEYYDIDNIWFNATIINATANTCNASCNDWDGENFGNFSMTNSSGNWHYNAIFPVNGYLCRVGCNDTDGIMHTSPLFSFSVVETPLFINILSPRTYALPVTKFRNTDNIWFNITFGYSIADTCFVNYGSGNITMTNSSGNWHYNATLSEGMHILEYWCNDTRGNSTSYHGNDFKVTSFGIELSSIAGQLIINIGLGVAGLFSILSLIYIGYNRQDPKEFVYIIIAITMIILIIVSVWQDIAFI